MMRLSITSLALEEAIALARNGGAPAILRAGLHSGTHSLDVFAGRPLREPGGTYALCDYKPPGGSGRPGHFALQAAGQAAGPLAVLIVSGAGSSARLRAWIRTEAGFQPADEVRLIGPGLPVLGAAPTASPALAPRWSRAAGALGESALRRLQELQVAVVGCGRNGSVVAMALARLGAGHLHLIDPDLVEVHNLDAMAAADVLSVGRPKAEVVASAARAVAAGGTVASHVVSGSSLASLETLLAADLIITTVDHDGVRWAVSAVAAVYLKPLFDVGSGFSGEQGAPVAGADVRLVLPGDACLDCLGGRGDEAHIETTRRGPRAEQRQAASRRWREERAGSLRSVNQVATGIGLRFVEALVAGRVDRSTWVQVTFGPDGVPAVSTARPGPRRASCRVCELAGTGDAGLEVLRETPMARNP